MARGRERSQGWRASSSSTSAGCGPLRDPRPRRRENPLPQPPYVILDPPPLDGVPVNGRVLRSCHHAHCARGVNLSSGSGASIIFLSTGSPDRVKSAFGSGHQARYPAGFPTRPPGGGGQHVPVSRRLSAAGIRFSVILARRGGLGAPCGRPTRRTIAPAPRRVTAFRTHELRPGWVPSIPWGRRCHPGLRIVLSWRCRATTASPLHPAPTSHPQGSA